MELTKQYYRIVGWTTLAELTVNELEVDITDEVVQLESEVAKLNYVELPNEKVSNVFEAYIAWKLKASQLESSLADKDKEIKMLKKERGCHTVECTARLLAGYECMCGYDKQG